MFALVSAYLALVIITRVDSLFFPGNQIALPGGSTVNKILPGVDGTGDSGNKNRINILVVGIDRRPSEGNELTRTDTIEIVTIDPKTKSAGILGIPRDLWVEIPGKRGGAFKDRINTALVYGQDERYPEGPVGLMKEVLQNNLHIKIDHYVLLDFNGFRKIIDALGGIDVDVPEEVYDPYYSETEKPGDYKPQHFYPGKQHMDGDTALVYSRIRFSSDDLDRIQRQQRVIFATIAKAKSVDVLKNAMTLWKQYKDAIQTDISDPLVPGYARLAKQVEDSNSIHAVSLGSATVPYITPQGADVLLGSPEAMQKIIDSIFSDQTSPDALGTATPEPVMVQVQNGTTTDQLAAHVADYIASKGYPVDDLNATNVFDGQTHFESEILDIDGKHAKNAYLLASWLKIPVSQVRTATSAERTKISGNPDVVVILGSDVDYAQLIQSPPTSVPGG